jgi:hypothetical protein
MQDTTREIQPATAGRPHPPALRQASRRKTTLERPLGGPAGRFKCTAVHADGRIGARSRTRRTSRPRRANATAPSSRRAARLRRSAVAALTHRWALVGRIHGGGDGRRTAGDARLGAVPRPHRVRRLLAELALQRSVRPVQEFRISPSSCAGGTAANPRLSDGGRSPDGRFSDANGNYF